MFSYLVLVKQRTTTNLFASQRKPTTGTTSEARKCLGLLSSKVVGRVAVRELETGLGSQAQLRHIRLPPRALVPSWGSPTEPHQNRSPKAITLGLEKCRPPKTYLERQRPAVMAALGYFESIVGYFGV